MLVGLDRTIPGGVPAMLFRSPANRRAEAAAQRRAIESLEFVGLAGDANRIAGQLPYGDQRRLEIARVVATGAKGAVDGFQGWTADGLPGWETGNCLTWE